MQSLYNTKEKVHNRGCEAVGKPISELVEEMDMKISGKKSQVGDAWESWFGVEKNNIAGADLPEAGVELKATGIRETKNGKSAKERLVLNIINYIEEFDKTFETSSFWKKNRYMELGFYGYEKEKSWLDWHILQSVLFTYPKKDLLIIKQDWEKIHGYITSGRAHELSEGLTMYLGACSKGANKNSLRNQREELNAPKAMQRAYSLKSSYMTYLLREYIFGEKEDSNIRVTPFSAGEIFEIQEDYHIQESIVKDTSILENESLEQYILKCLNRYSGKTIIYLAELFGIQKNSNGNFPKSINAMLASRMLGIYGNLEKTEEFFKANISLKTIRVSLNGTIKESMSFPAFKFKELASENWEESTLRDTMDASKFLFIVFKEQVKDNYVFKGAKFWTMPEKDLDTIVQDAWQDTVNTLNSGVELTYQGNSVKNNFIKKSDKRIIHVRPHASVSSYLAGDTVNADQLPVAARWKNKPEAYADDWMTKQCFWLNNDYILSQISDLL
ncbi:hypothetical protein DOK78_000272 [Enterococcus sp. DIV2402]|uniref:DNA mismatch repair MutH/Type II restriction enzyme Sau3AI domain-containing protein n=1 Tax=Candidatus Enterococcus lowellii TaxID=2230877 RepID=A0ABZ2SMU4_9ENTE|nr:MutH/Sau3AI family endonuclease [Enterococcus sp. DIV2402]MBO0464760.1 hypothetical protein [Enterococcus sp. DIV2402]